VDIVDFFPIPITTKTAIMPWLYEQSWLNVLKNYALMRSESFSLNLENSEKKAVAQIYWFDSKSPLWLQSWFRPRIRLIRHYSLIQKEPICIR